MVKLEEVLDEEFTADQKGPEGGEEDWDTDTDSILSDDSDDLTSSLDESLLDRITALKDVIPPTQRRYISSTFEAASSWFSTGVNFSGKALWVVSTSALLLGVPWALAFAEEQQMMEMEREMKMQQSANELLTQQPGGEQGARPAL